MPTWLGRRAIIGIEAGSGLTGAILFASDAAAQDTSVVLRTSQGVRITFGTFHAPS